MTSKPILVVLTATCLLLLSACADSSRLPGWATAPAMPERSYTPEGCIIERFAVPSPSMGRVIRGVIVLPPAYATDPERRFPILYALHGMDATYLAWSEMPPLRAALAGKPMLVASFDGDRASMYLDSDIPQPARKGDDDASWGKVSSRFTTFFFCEFLPWVDAHYRVDTKRRMLTGFSMGAYGAMHYLLQQPESFVSVSGLSGAFMPSAEANRGVPGYFIPLLGEPAAKPDRYRNSDLLLRLQDFFAAGRKLPPCLFLCGTEDRWGLLLSNRGLGWMLAAHGQPEAYRELPGKHDWTFWKTASPSVIDFHWRTLPTVSTTSGPSAPAPAPTPAPGAGK